MLDLKKGKRCPFFQSAKYPVMASWNSQVSGLSSLFPSLFAAMRVQLQNPVGGSWVQDNSVRDFGKSSSEV